VPELIEDDLIHCKYLEKKGLPGTFRVDAAHIQLSRFFILSYDMLTYDFHHACDPGIRHFFDDS
jgi:hypothetical protein